MLLTRKCALRMRTLLLLSSASLSFVESSLNSHQAAATIWSLLPVRQLRRGPFHRLLSIAERPVTVCSHLHMSPSVCVAVLTMRCCRHVATSFANWSRYKSPRESEVTTSQPPAGHPKRNKMRMRMLSGRCREACHQLLKLRGMAGPTLPANY